MNVLWTVGALTVAGFVVVILLGRAASAAVLVLVVSATFVAVLFLRRSFAMNYDDDDYDLYSIRTNRVDDAHEKRRSRKGRVGFDPVDAEHMAKWLNKRVLGQQLAVSMLSLRISSAIGKPAANRRGPLASGFLGGGTGVGKTFIAELIAEYLDVPLYVLNCGSLREGSQAKTEVFGAAPSYHGNPKGTFPRFIESTDGRFVALIDEYEKAPADMEPALLAPLDCGEIQDGHGRGYSVENGIIIFTSNIHAEQLTELAGKLDGPELELASREALKREDPASGKKLRPEMVGRLDLVVPMFPLDFRKTLVIADRLLVKAVEAFELELPRYDAVDERLLYRCVDVSMRGKEGARGIKRWLQTYLDHPLHLARQAGAQAVGIAVAFDGPETPTANFDVTVDVLSQRDPKNPRGRIVHPDWVHNEAGEMVLRAHQGAS